MALDTTGRIFLQVLIIFASTGLVDASTTNWCEILDAIWAVESSRCYNPPNGDNNKAAGPYQIHRIYVDDLNRILGHKAFTYDDRRDFKKSRRMTYLYCRYYGKGLPPIEAARNHQGGPYGYKKQSTLNYKAKLIKALENK